MKTYLFSAVVVAGLLLATDSKGQQTGKSSNGSEQTVQAGQPVQQRTFVDADNDGVCDNFATRPANGRGRNFVDNNNDGICDRNVDSNRSGRGKGKGFGRCQQGRKGSGLRGGRGWRGPQNQPVKENTTPNK
ncbi:MAG: hypothetical protein PHU33_04590 [Bacteroidales bacterium]|nr:hypothetical protein [Bacteroidales bacterium]